MTVPDKSEFRLDPQAIGAARDAWDRSYGLWLTAAEAAVRDLIDRGVLIVAPDAQSSRKDAES